MFTLFDSVFLLAGQLTELADAETAVSLSRQWSSISEIYRHCFSATMEHFLPPSLFIFSLFFLWCITSSPSETPEFYCPLCWFSPQLCWTSYLQLVELQQVRVHDGGGPDDGEETPLL